MNLIHRNNTPAPAYRPGGYEDQFGRLVENIFEDMFAPFAFNPATRPNEGVSSPRLNVTETDKSFEIQVEMPGVKKEDVKVAIDQQRVTIEGECRTEKEQREGATLMYSERSARKYMRSFALPSDVDDSQSQAHMEDGVLTLTLPKKQGGSAKRLTVS
ncbi:MAG: Hsp20/alpha crystallin family protein [Pseudomonadota bacterium]